MMLLVASAPPVKAGSVDSYYHYDGQLSTRSLSDSTETITDKYTYDAFGNVLEQTGITENNYLYTGEQYDENIGFYYLRARYYDTGVGRFITTDPWSGSAYDPPSLHKYLYAGADPINNWDPSGMMNIPEINIASAVSATLNNFTRIAYIPIVQIATRLTIPITSIQSLCGRGPNVLQSLSRLGPNAINTIRNAYLQTYSYITQSQALQSPNYSSHNAIRAAYNRIFTGNPYRNPLNIEYHHIVENLIENVQNFGARAINSMANVVPISNRVHSVITSYQNSAPQWLRDLSSGRYSHVYEYVRTLSWNQQYEFGIKMLQHATRYGTLNDWIPPSF